MPLWFSGLMWLRLQPHPQKHNRRRNGLALPLQTGDDGGAQRAPRGQMADVRGRRAAVRSVLPRLPPPERRAIETQAAHIFPPCFCFLCCGDLRLPRPKYLANQCSAYESVHVIEVSCGIIPYCAISGAGGGRYTRVVRKRRTCRAVRLVSVPAYGLSAETQRRGGIDAPRNG